MSIWTGTSGGSDPTISPRITNLEDTEYVYELWESIGSGTTGTVALTAGGIILLDRYQGAADALIVEIQDGIPGDKPVFTSSSTLITTTFDVDGNYVLSGIPSAYPIALIYQIKIKAKYIHLIPLSQIIQKTDISNSNSLFEYSKIETDFTNYWQNSWTNGGDNAWIINGQYPYDENGNIITNPTLNDWFDPLKCTKFTNEKNHPGIVIFRPVTDFPGLGAHTNQEITLHGQEKFTTVTKFGNNIPTSPGSYGFLMGMFEEDGFGALTKNHVGFLMMDALSFSVVGSIYGNNSQITTTSFALSKDIWYRFEIVILADLSTTFKIIASDTQTLVWENTIAHPNFPGSTSDEAPISLRGLFIQGVYNPGILSATGTDWSYFDYISFETTRKLIR